MRAVLLAVALASPADLTDATFEAWVKEHHHALVLFHAPWCGHCKQLRPDFERAAAFLQTAKPPVHLAQVDATTEVQLAEDHEIRGYPTLKFFADGVATEYTGGRTGEAMVAWCMKKVGPAVQDLADVDAFLKDHEVAVVVHADVDQLAVVKQVARETEDIVFGRADAAACAGKGLQSPCMQMHFPHDDKVAAFQGSLDNAEELRTFIATYRLPKVVKFDGDIAPVLFGDTRPILFVFTEASDGTSEAEKALEAAAPALLGQVLMSTCGAFEPMDQRLMDYVGVEESMLPAVRLVAEAGGPMRKYKFDGAASADALAQFVQDFFAGKLPLDLKSEPEPTQSGPVLQLVGSTFPKLVVDQPKDVLVLFMAPWCGHCKKIAPVWRELGAKLQGSPGVVVAQIDATANDVEGEDITGFPTIKLYKQDAKQSPAHYDGERDVASIMAWLRDSHGLDVKDEL